MLNKPMPAWARPIADKVNSHEATLQTINAKLESLEETYTDISDIKRIVQRIWRAIKWGAPSVITAAVTAGYINGDFAKLLTAVFQ